jgi:hypothetical protein
MKNIVLIPLLLIAFTGLLNINRLNAQDNAEPTFADFLAQFPKASLPYTMTAQDLQEQIQPKPNTKVNRLGWDYYSFLPELERSAQYSNMPVYPEPVAVFETRGYYAVLYNLARGLSKGTKTYSITVYDLDGGYIGTQFIAGINAKEITAVRIEANLMATVEVLKIEKDGLRNYDKQTIDLLVPGNPDQLGWSDTTQPGKLDSSSIAGSK